MADPPPGADPAGDVPPAAAPGEPALAGAPAAPAGAPTPATSIEAVLAQQKAMLAAKGILPTANGTPGGPPPPQGPATSVEFDTVAAAQKAAAQLTATINGVPPQPKSMEFRPAGALPPGPLQPPYPPGPVPPGPMYPQAALSMAKSKSQAAPAAMAPMPRMMGCSSASAPCGGCPLSAPMPGVPAGMMQPMAAATPKMSPGWQLPNRPLALGGTDPCTGQGLAPTTAKFAPRGPPASPCVPAAATAPPENRPQVPPAALEGLSEVSPALAALMSGKLF
mmetsp:Transcript_42901/g.96342  ORF Transcript_42901/g.96342 Transcript_42901/m.96342 type:complete len:279 (-) Transcript_42901:47-883(-)